MAKTNTMRKVSLRNIFAHKLRLLLTLLAVVLGTAFIAGSLMFTNSLSQTFDSAVSTAYTGVDAALSKKDGGPSLDQNLRDSVAADPKVREVNVESAQTVVVASQEAEAYQTGGGQSTVRPYYPPNHTVGQPAELVEGKEPSGVGEVVINDSAAEKFGITVGQDVLVVHPDKRDTVRIVGIVKPAVDQGSSITLQMNAPDFLQRYGNSESLKVAAADGVTPEVLVDHLNSTYDAKAESGQKLADDMSEQISSALKFVNYFLIAFGLIALLVGTFIITNTFSMIVAQRTKEFALLRALGAARRQITASVITEAVIVGLLGSLIGVVAGIGLVAAIKAIMQAQGMPIGEGLGLSASALAVPVVLGIVVTVVSAWAPARRAGAVKPVEAMRSTETAAGSSLKARTIAGVVLLGFGAACALIGALTEFATSIRASIVGVGAFAAIVGFFLAGPALSLPIVPALGRGIGKPFGAIGALAATNSRRNPRRTAATAFALTLGVALVTAIGMLGASMKSSVADVMDKNVSADFLLTGPTSGNFPTPAETPERARAAEGAGTVTALSTAPLAIDGAASMSYGPQFTRTLTINDNPTELFNFEMVEGSPDLGAQPGFLATEEFAAEHGWKVGESYPVTAPVGGKPTEAQLVGTFVRNNVVENMVLSQSLAEQVVPADALEVAMVGVNAAPGADPEALRGELTAAVKDLVVVQVMSGEEFAGQAAGFIDQMLAILYALLALAVVIAILGIVNTLTLGVIERRQEIGMLRAVGVQRRQIRTMITLEAVQISVFGAVMGMALGLGLGWAFIRVLASQGLDTIAVPWGQLAVMLGASAVVGMVAALWPAQRAAKTPPLDAIAD